MIHASKYQPRVFPWNRDITPAEIDRAQDIGGDLTLNREEINEIGRDGKVGDRDRIPTYRYTLRQLEFGQMEFYRKIANKSDSDKTVNLNDFKTSVFDIASYTTDDDETFKQTIWVPKLRLAGMGINIGDPDAIVERTFEFVGEDYKMLQGNNQYFIYVKADVASGESSKVITLDDPIPAENPDVAGKYMLRVLRIRSDSYTELEETTDYTYDNVANELTVTGCQAGDVIKVYYSASSYITGQIPFTPNDADSDALYAENCSIYLGVGNYIHRLQSVTLDIALDRRDIKEIGNSEIVETGVRNKTARVTLGRILEDLTIEEVLRGVGANYGIIDPRKFVKDITLIAKIYETSAKSNFKIGYKITNLAANGLTPSVPLEDYVTQGATLESDNLLITDDEGEL